MNQKATLRILTRREELPNVDPDSKATLNFDRLIFFSREEGACQRCDLAAISYQIKHDFDVILRVRQGVECQGVLSSTYEFYRFKKIPEVVEARE